ncbi:hypothetical protein DL98DRAFT_516660 [Cadophora sp. DSE1049]|nr:hypothetical protein DL98DRAFT_516660 [Cadophora sp. DSE1049]
MVGFESSQVEPGMLFACKESHEVAKAKLVKMLGTFVNVEMEVVWFKDLDPKSLMETFDDLMTDLYEKLTVTCDLWARLIDEEEQHLMFGLSGLVWKMFPDLEELSMVFVDNPPDTGQIYGVDRRHRQVNMLKAPAGWEAKVVEDVVPGVRDSLGFREADDRIEVVVRRLRKSNDSPERARPEAI